MTAPNPGPMASYGITTPAIRITLTPMNLARLFLCSIIGLPAVADAAEFLLANERPPIQSRAIQEASGIAVSPKDSRFLWAINDSGGTAELHLFNTDGTERGQVKVTGANNLDWEDLASFTLDGKSWLLIADTGDNLGIRKTVTLQIRRWCAIRLLPRCSMRGLPIITRHTHGLFSEYCLGGRGRSFFSNWMAMEAFGGKLAHSDSPSNGPSTDQRGADADRCD